MPTLERHVKTLQERIPPVVNINCVIYKKHKDGTLYDPEIFLWLREKNINTNKWIFPWWRLQIDEQPQEAAIRILHRECRGITILPKKLITATTTDNDIRSWNCNLYYLCEYIDWNYNWSDTFIDHQWIPLQQLENTANLRETDKLIIEDIKQTISMVNSNQDELLVEVDENDKEIGNISKKIAHSTNTRHHRAAHIFVFSSEWEVLLQLRSRHKSSSPLKWDMHGWHQIVGQTIDQCAYAELSEEVWITGNLIFHHSKHFTKTNQSEFAHVYTIIHDWPYGYDSNEVERLQTFDCQKLIDGFYDNDYDILDHVKVYLEELRDIWEQFIQSSL